MSRVLRGVEALAPEQAGGAPQQLGPAVCRRRAPPPSCAAARAGAWARPRAIGRALGTGMPATLAKPAIFSKRALGENTGLRRAPDELAPARRRTGRETGLCQLAENSRFARPLSQEARMTYPNTQLFIDGQWQDAADGRTPGRLQPRHRQGNRPRRPCRHGRPRPRAGSRPKRLRELARHAGRRAQQDHAQGRGPDARARRRHRRCC